MAEEPIPPQHRPLPLIEASLASLKTVLPKLLQWRLPHLDETTIQTVFVQGTEYVKAIENLKNRPSFPFFTVSMQSLSLNQASFNRAMMTKYGIRAAITDSRNEVANLHLQPILIQVMVGLVSDSMDHVLQGAAAWLERAEFLDVEVELLDPSYSFPIQIRGQMDVSFPESRTIEDTPAYMIQFPLTLDTYTGWEEITPTVKFVAGQTAAYGRVSQFEAERVKATNWPYALQPDTSIFSQFKINVRTKARTK